MAKIREMGGYIDPPYLQVQISKGREYIYFRAPGAPRTRIDPEADDFMKNYKILRRLAERGVANENVPPSSPEQRA